MTVRIADSSIFRNTLRVVQESRAELTRLQDQVSSGRRLQTPADDPAGTARTLDLREGLAQIQQFERNIQTARSQLDNTESVLNSMTNLLIRARELSVSADVERDQFDLIQAEVEELFGELLGLANTRTGNRYLFGGFVTDSAPITQTGTFTDPAPIVAYGGDSGVIAASVGINTTIDVNITARELFLGSTDNDDTADGNGVSLFDVLQDLRNRLADPVANGEPTEVLDELDRGLDQVNQLRSRVGSRTNRLDTTLEQLASVRISNERERSDIEDVDFVEAITALQSREAAYQAALSVTARVVQQSLLDFLR